VPLKEFPQSRPPVELLPLPKAVIEGLRERGITTLTPPQAAAIERGLLRWANMIVATPTASGKTLIAELALLNSFFMGRKGIYITPLKTLASEKANEFSYWKKIGLSVGLTTGDYDEPGEWLGEYDVIVATYERMDSIFRLKPSWLSDVGVVVIDEFHMIGDADRGPIVELLAVKALRLGAQLIGLSATIGNPEELSTWLGSQLVTSDWRPVKLIEGYYSRSRRTIVFENGRKEKVEGSLPKHILKKTLEGGYQSIIFVHSRNRAESLARKLSEEIKGDSLMSSTLVNELSKSNAPSIEKESLKPLLRKGLAYHHAGLSLDSRSLIERNFRKGNIKLIVATPTLAAGINMPARRVLIYTKRYESGFMRPISISEYKQMAGRAGRPQYDPYGEAIIADAPDETYAMKYISGEPEDVRSALISERALRIHILAMVASRDTRTFHELFNLMSKTLAFNQLGRETGERAIEYTVNRLIDMNMVKVEGIKLKPTRLGAYVSRLYIDPLSAVMMLEAVRDVKEAHPLYYLVGVAMTPDFNRARVTRFREYEEEANAALENGIIPSPLEGVGYYDWLRAFKLGKILNAWIEEVPEDKILEIYKIGAGDLRNIVETAEWLLYAYSRVCDAENLKKHSRELAKLAIRVRHGVKEELIDLVRVKGIGRVRARSLFSAGIRSVAELSRINPERISALPGFGKNTAKWWLRKQNG
jgi:helicase